MLSQRVEDFVRTDLGRTLAATSSSKLVLGTEEAVVDEVRDVFKLRDEEVAAICPSVPGRGVLAGRRRARGGQRRARAGDHGARRHRGPRAPPAVVTAATEPVISVPAAAHLVGGAQRAPPAGLRLPGHDRAGGAAGAGAALRGQQPGLRRGAVDAANQVDAATGVVVGTAEPCAPGTSASARGSAAPPLSAEPLPPPRLRLPTRRRARWLPAVPHRHRPGRPERPDCVRRRRTARSGSSSRRSASASTSC